MVLLRRVFLVAQVRFHPGTQGSFNGIFEKLSAECRELFLELQVFRQPLGQGFQLGVVRSSAHRHVLLRKHGQG